MSSVFKQVAIHNVIAFYHFKEIVPRSIETPQTLAHSVVMIIRNEQILRISDHLGNFNIRILLQLRFEISKRKMTFYQSGRKLLFYLLGTVFAIGVSKFYKYGIVKAHGRDVFVIFYF